MAESKTASAAGKRRSSEIVENLLAKGKKNGGTLTYGELIDALQKQDLTPDEIDTMYDTFSKRGIEIVDDSQDNSNDDDVDLDKSDEDVRSTSLCRRVSASMIRCACTSRRSAACPC